MSSSLRRAWLLVNVAITVALLPALFPGPTSGSGVAVAAGPGDVITVARSADALASSTTTTTIVVTTTTPPTTAVDVHAAHTATSAPARRPAVRVPAHTTATTVKQRPRTTSTAAPAPKQAASPPPASGSESGKATWYDYKPGICAHKTLPFGTVVTVRAVNGKSVQCTVGDRGPFVDGYVIDLNQREFEQLAPRSTGRIDVTITW